MIRVCSIRFEFIINVRVSFSLRLEFRFSVYIWLVLGLESGLELGQG